MTSGPRILITNDDGVDAPGIAVMLGIARTISEDVFVVAPAANQSGVGHRFSFGHELELDRRDRNIYAIAGTPADCVVVGCTHLLKSHPPDIVLSGVNNGQNLGDIINCSGTLAGAREGAMQGCLGIAMSQAVDYERNHDVVWDCAKNHGASVVNAILAAAKGTGTYYNVNFPLGDPRDVTRMRVVAHERFRRSPFAYYPSRTEGKFFIAIPETPSPLDPANDYHVLQHERAITVTPLSLQQTDAETSKRLQQDLESGLSPQGHGSR